MFNIFSFKLIVIKQHLFKDKNIINNIIEDGLRKQTN